MKLNKEWHLKHPMPANATLDERIAWHLEHHKNCKCRNMPESIRRALQQKGIKIPN